MKYQFSLFAAALVVSVALLLGGCSSQPEIAVNLPGPEDGLDFNTPADEWDQALPLGNGIMGALVWGDGKPLRISLDRADLWDLRPIPEYRSDGYNFERVRRLHQQGKHDELIKLLEDPYRRPAPTKIPAGRIELTFPDDSVFERTRLDLATATGNVTFASGASAEIFVHATEPVGMIRVSGTAAPALRLAAPAFAGEAAGGDRDQGRGDLRQLGYSAPEETSGDGWVAYSQQGAEGFHYAVHAQWKQSGGGWLAAWSVASSFEGRDPLALAKQRAGQMLEGGWDTAHGQHKDWWDDYWHDSSVRIPNPTIERLWFLEQYKFGSAARRGAPPISLQAIWTADNGRLPPWKGDYHHDLNTELSYWPAYGGNHLEEGLSFLDWLWDTRDTAFAWTKQYFRMPGLNVPMTADLEGNQIGGWRQYTHSATTAAWLAHHFYLHWRYSADREFLEQRAYPYLRDAAIFLEAYTATKGADGLRTHPLSASPEINDNKPDAWFDVYTNYDLALERWLFSKAAELAAELDLAEDAARWRKVLSELPDFYLGEAGELLVAEDYPLTESHRHHSNLMAIHPLGLIDWSRGEEARRIIRASLDHLEELGTDRWTGYSFSWLANVQARARDGAKAAEALEIFSNAFTLRSSFHCNGDQSGKGYSKFTYTPFTLEGNFAAAAGIQEMLLQSHAGRIEVFPAVPDSWQDVSFTTLRAEGAFLVSAEREQGRTTRVDIMAEKDGTCKILSPFTGEIVALEMTAGETKTLVR